MIDLHVHSMFSDGSHSPEQLIEAAQRAGLKALALTDHDTMDGIEPFLAAGAKAGIRTVPGVEISCDFSPGSLHMLGYYVDHGNQRLAEALRRIREGRKDRNKRILKRLNALGMPLRMQEVEAFAGSDVVGRPHFARALVKRGCVSSIRQAFDRFLAKGQPAYADRFRLSAEQSIEILAHAGGLAVLAHPFTLQLDRPGLQALVAQLAEQGLQGIEVYYPEHSDGQTRQYTKLARTHGLALTGGTDYHGSGMPHIRIGSGHGSLNVPDALLDELERRQPGKVRARP